MCDKCSDARKDQPVLGMTIVEGVKKNADEPYWDGGTILDPNNGKIYKVRMTPKDGGKSSRCAASSARSTATRPGSASSERHHGETMNRFQVRKVAVLGAGVMGAQIAAHLVNCKVPVVLFDLPAKEGPKNGIVTKAVEGLKKLKPAPLGVPEDAALIQQANYEEHLALLGECDLVIEAIAERMDWKLDLYQKIAPALAPHAIVASNTSGLSITKLAEVLPEAIQPRFCGIHFFNPPRYMALVELIDTPATQPEVLDQLEAFVTTQPGQERGARQGHAELHRQPRRHRRHAGDDQGGRELRPVATTWSTTSPARSWAAPAAAPSAPPTWWAWTRWRTSSRRCRTTWPTTRSSRATPRRRCWPALIDKGALGQKAGAGFFKKVGKDILRLDPAKGDYVPAGGKAEPIVERMLKKPAAERLKLLRESSNPQAQFLWAILRDAFHYAAVHLETIAESARDVDFAMRWGFGMKQGPFELWQDAGWQQVAAWVKEDIDAGKALSTRAAAGLGVRRPHRACTRPKARGARASKAYVPRSSLPVYGRQHFPESVLGAGAPRRR